MAKYRLDVDIGLQKEPVVRPFDVRGTQSYLSDKPQGFCDQSCIDPRMAVAAINTNSRIRRLELRGRIQKRMKVLPRSARQVFASKDKHFTIIKHSEAQIVRC